MQSMVAVTCTAIFALRALRIQEEEIAMKVLAIATILALGMTSAIISVAHAHPTWTGTYFEQLSKEAE